MLITYGIIFAVLVAADLISKALVCPVLIENGGALPLLPGLVGLKYTQNTGMAWGLMQNSTLFLTVSSVLACALMAFILVKNAGKMPKHIGLGFAMVISGAVGNLFDRIVLHFVRDFITFEFIDFPIFNVADICVTVGCVLIIGGFILTKSGREYYKHMDDDWTKKHGKLKDERQDGPDAANGGGEAQAKE